MILSLVVVRSCNFGWSSVYDCKAYLETNTVQNCSYFGFGGYFLVSGTFIKIIIINLKFIIIIIIIINFIIATENNPVVKTNLRKKKKTCQRSTLHRALRFSYHPLEKV